MAIAATKAVIAATAPTATNQIIVRGPGDVNIDVYRGYAQITQDGSTSSGTIQYIDGTLALPFTPSFIQVFRYKPAAIGVVASISATSGGTGYAVGSVAQLSQPNYGGYGATASVATIYGWWSSCNLDPSKIPATAYCCYLRGLLPAPSWANRAQGLLSPSQ